MEIYEREFTEIADLMLMSWTVSVSRM